MKTTEETELPLYRISTRELSFSSNEFEEAIITIHNCDSEEEALDYLGRFFAWIKEIPLGGDVRPDADYQISLPRTEVGAKLAEAFMDLAHRRHVRPETLAQKVFVEFLLQAGVLSPKEWDVSYYRVVPDQEGEPQKGSISEE